jgi:hypothetical protein
MVTALIGLCIRHAWKSSDKRGAWIGRVFPFATTGALEHVHGAGDDIFARIRRWEGTPAHPYGHSGNSDAIPDARVDV